MGQNLTSEMSDPAPGMKQHQVLPKESGNSSASALHWIRKLKREAIGHFFSLGR